MITKCIKEVIFLILSVRNMPFTETGDNLIFFSGSFLCYGGICKTQAWSDKGNATRDTIPVLPLLLPEKRNIRNQ